jgi:hypothetical protein
MSEVIRRAQATPSDGKGLTSPRNDYSVLCLRAFNSFVMHYTAKRLADATA